MRVAVIATNDARNVSGGRYHAMMLAAAVAALGWEAHVLTDNKPAFFDDLAGLAPQGVRLSVAPDFSRHVPEAPFDWVFVVPTGIFLPEFYESCVAFARAAGARLGLVNFEAATWFNALAPEPRDPRLWDYWRRVCVEGALVLSSARESNAWARAFYAAPEGAIRFEVWRPPIHSAAAQRFDGTAKDGSVVAFVRPEDGHKGSAFFSRMDPALFRGRTLHLISGRDVPAPYQAAVEARLGAARVAFHVRIDDSRKFQLLTAAQAVLFPSRFEGYGYPPVEAAFSGTESAVFDLPVLRETVGGVAHFAPTPDLTGFEAATAAALAAPERRAALRAAVADIAEFPRAAARLADILLRSAESVAPLAARRFRALVGPFARSAPAAPETVDRHAPAAPFPPYVVGAATTTAGELVITLRFCAPAAVTRFEASTAGAAALPAAWEVAPAAARGFKEVRLYVLAPARAVGEPIAVAAFAGEVRLGEPIAWRVERPEPADADLPGVAGVSENHAGATGRRLRAWVLACEALSDVLLLPDGRTPFAAAVAGGRGDVRAKYPAYPAARCEFRIEIPATSDLDPGAALLFCLADGEGRRRAVDALVGWPPRPRPRFAEAAPAGQPPAEAGGPRRPKIGEAALAPANDARWRHGVALVGGAGRLGAVALAKAAPEGALRPGAVLRLSSGRARRIAAVERGGAFDVAVLDGPLDPEDAGPERRASLHDGEWTPALDRSFVAPPWTDESWWRGVWNVAGDRFRRGLRLPAAEARALRLQAGAILRFAASGPRRILEIVERDGHAEIWLEGRIRPIGDAGRPVLARGDAGAPGGPDGALRFDFAEGARDAILIEGEAARDIAAGSLLRFGTSGVARALAVNAEPRRARVTLDRRLDLRAQDSGLARVDEADLPDGYLTPYRYPGSDLKAKDPLFQVLAREAMKRGAGLRAARPVASAERRALVVSAVSPCPANQGNRVVTRNLIRHLIALGFQCDVVVQNGVDAADAADEFGLSAKFFMVRHPQWETSQAHELRRSAAAAAELLARRPLEAGPAGDLQEAAGRYHPYFIVRDETVDLARTLYARRAYECLIVNYTHMLRVAEELQDIRPLPPTAVVTHDALSRLPRAFEGQTLELGYRACAPQMERDVLNAVPGARVVAISRSEARYFHDIGVHNPIVTTEYDACEEMAPFVAPEDAFDRRTLIFHGSANPMNVAGLNWFVDECWAQIRAAVPAARLVVCGRIGAVWDPKLPGVEVVGEQTRARMLRLCAGASVAVNPCVAGTGLKIKTVETAALGLPAVCLPTATDGLEDDAAQFAIVAEGAEAFTAACVALMSDRARWGALRRGAREVAARRFDARTVYRALDAAMGWDAPPPENAAPETAEAAAGPKPEGETPWRRAVQAGREIAQRPERLPGYLAMAQALLDAGLADEAAAAAEQGALIAPFDPAAQRLLVEALARAGRASEAEAWRARPTLDLTLGRYFPLAASLLSGGARGFERLDGETLGLRSGEASLLLPAPQGAAKRLSVALEIAGDERSPTELELRLGPARRSHRLGAGGASVHTIRIEADASVFESGGARLVLRLAPEAVLEAPLRLIGLTIDARET